MYLFSKVNLEEDIKIEKKSQWIDLTIEEHILKVISNRGKVKKSYKLVAKERGISKSEVYKYSLDL